MRAGAWLAVGLASASVPGMATAQEAADKLQKDLQNPISSVVSVPFQENVGFNTNPNGGTSSVLLMQPVMPIPLTPRWNYIVRPIIPIASIPITSDQRDTGLGDIDLETFFSPAHPGKVIWGLGPDVLFPSGTGGLTQRQWGLGPAFVALVQPPHWNIGFLAAQVWRVGGGRPDNVPELSTFTFEPFAARMYEHGWTVAYFGSPWTANFGLSEDKWTIPIGLHVNKLMKPAHGFPIQFSVGVYGNVVRAPGQPDWFLQFQVQPVLPDFWKTPWFH